MARLVADVLYVGYTRGSKRWTESRLYFTVVWSTIAFGCTILLLGFDQPLVLVTISTVLGGAIMVVYTCLLFVTNRRYLPEPIRLRGYRLAVLVFAVLLLGHDDGDRRRRPVQDPLLRRGEDEQRRSTAGTSRNSPEKANTTVTAANAIAAATRAPPARIRAPAAVAST